MDPGIHPNSQHAKAHPEDLNPSTVEKTMTVVPYMQKNLHDAYVAGVKIAFGADTFGMSRHGENAQEFAIMVRAGMTPMDAIRSATSRAADMLDATGDLGVIAPGAYADIIAVDTDPLRDIHALHNVSFVMKNGEVVRATTK